MRYMDTLYQHEKKEVLIGCETESQFDISLISLGRKWDATEVSETGKEKKVLYMV